jgi:hypothetical protein
MPSGKLQPASSTAYRVAITTAIALFATVVARRVGSHLFALLNLLVALIGVGRIVGFHSVGLHFLWSYFRTFRMLVNWEFSPDL